MKGTKIVLAMALVFALVLAAAGCKSDSDATYRKVTQYEFTSAQEPASITAAEAILIYADDVDEWIIPSQTFAEYIRGELGGSSKLTIIDQNEPKVLYKETGTTDYYLEILGN